MISVCLASYNGMPYISAQISSILSQLSNEDELIISDDGSNDGTEKYIAECAQQDFRVTVLQGPCLGLQLNFENALNHAKGSVIFLADQDDIWMPNKVRVMVDELNNCDLVVSDCYVVNRDLDIIHESFFSINNSENGLIRNIMKNSHLGCCMAFNRKVLSHALPFPKNIPMHDWWIGLVAQSIGNVKLIDAQLILYRRHGSNASPTSEKSNNTLFRKIALRVKILIELVVVLLVKKADDK